MKTPSGIAAVAVVSALLGGTGALLVGKVAGWVGASGQETIVVPASEIASPARVSTELPDAASAKPLPGNEFDAAEIYRRRAGGVVTVIALFGEHAERGTGAASQGSGFVVSPEGYVLTNSHVVTSSGDDLASPPRAATNVYVEFRDGDRAPARVVGWDVFNDVALLTVDPSDHELRPVPLGDSSRVLVGEPVAAIGSPFGQESSLSVGVVSATGRSINSLTSSYDIVDAIQTDTPINRGNSGGPLLDARGRAVGINAQIRSESGNAEGVGFAIPINSAKRSMEQLIATGRVRYAWLGVSTQTLTPRLARRLGYGAARGAAVQSVVADSPAAAAGLEGGTEEKEFEGLELSVGGDLIVAIDGVPVETAEDVIRVVSARLPGEKAVLTIVRGGEKRNVEVVLGERPANPPGTDR